MAWRMYFQVISENSWFFCPTISTWCLLPTCRINTFSTSVLTCPFPSSKNSISGHYFQVLKTVFPSYFWKYLIFFVQLFLLDVCCHLFLQHLGCTGHVCEISHWVISCDIHFNMNKHLAQSDPWIMYDHVDTWYHLMFTPHSEGKSKGVNSEVFTSWGLPGPSPALLTSRQVWQYQGGNEKNINWRHREMMGDGHTWNSRDQPWPIGPWAICCRASCFGALHEQHCHWWWQRLGMSVNHSFLHSKKTPPQKM